MSFPQVRTGRVAAAIAALLAMVFSVAAPALGQDDSAPALAPELLLVDTTDDPFLLVRTQDAFSEAGVSTDGTAAVVGDTSSVADSGLDTQTIIIIDNSAESEEFLDEFKAAATAYIDEAPANEEISVWTTGGLAQVRTGFNDDHERNALIVDRILAASGSNHLWDTVRESALDYDEPVAGLTTMVILTGNTDFGSAVTPEQARGSVLNNRASVFMVHGAESISEDETRMVDVSDGGAFAQATDESDIPAFGSAISTAVANTYVVEFSGDAVATSTDVILTVDGESVAGTYSFGSTSYGSGLELVLDPEPTTVPGLGFLSGDTGRMLGLIFGVAAAGLGVYAVISLFVNDDEGLSDVLNQYTNTSYTDPDADSEGGNSILKSLFVKRAVAITEDLAERRGTLDKVEGLLERADLPLRAGEALSGYFAIFLGSLAVGLLLFGGLVPMLICGVLGILLPPMLLRFLANRRSSKFSGQLPDTLQLLSSTLKAGYSFMQGVEAVSHEVEEPMGGELRRVVTEAQLGRPLEEAMDASAERMESEDFAWCVMAVRIQREVGGNLAELLMTVAETMTARERLRRDIQSLTAEGRASSVVLALLPILLGLAMYALNPKYISLLFSETLGNFLLGASVVAMLIGFVWMKKLIDIEI